MTSQLHPNQISNLVYEIERVMHGAYRTEDLYNMAKNITKDKKKFMMAMIYNRDLARLKDFIDQQLIFNKK